MWDFTSTDAAGPLAVHATAESTTALCYSASYGRLVLADASNALLQMDSETGAVVSRMTGHKSAATALAAQDHIVVSGGTVCVHTVLVCDRIIPF